MSREIEGAVAAHYAQGDLESALLAEMAKAGFDPHELTAADLAPMDEFHIGGLEASKALARHLPEGPGCRLLDIGCGIGGPARFFAEALDCEVVGIDLTPDFIAVAEGLTRRVGLGDHVSFHVASALDLPFHDAAFDCATLLHVGMNIADKQALFAEAARVLQPGATFAVYDVMRLAPGDLNWPLPWSSVPETSFVGTQADYRQALEAAGFEIKVEVIRAPEAKEFFRRQRQRIEAGEGGPSLAPIMGETFQTKIANMVTLIGADVLAPVEMIALRHSR